MCIMLVYIAKQTCFIHAYMVALLCHLNETCDMRSPRFMSTYSQDQLIFTVLLKLVTPPVLTTDQRTSKYCLTLRLTFENGIVTRTS